MTHTNMHKMKMMILNCSEPSLLHCNMLNSHLFLFSMCAGKLKFKLCLLQLLTHKVTFVHKVLFGKMHGMFSFIFSISYFEVPGPDITLELQSLVAIMLSMTVMFFTDRLDKCIRCFRKVLSGNRSLIVVGALA